VSVLLGNGDGSFQARSRYDVSGVNSYSVAIGDVNGDSHPDLVVASLCQQRGIGCTGEVSVLLGNGDGTFQRATVYGSGGWYTSSVKIADLNLDGRPDLVAANGNDSGPGGTVGVLLNIFSAKTTTVLTSSPNPSLVNQTVTMTATIASTRSIADGQTVTFYKGETEIGTGTTTNGVAALTTSFSSAGKFAIKANYPGDAFHKASSGTVKQVVNP
jgi:Bacterial Ig-like domain (group 3)/FG-GAP-like repeat